MQRKAPIPRPRTKSYTTYHQLGVRGGEKERQSGAGERELEVVREQLETANRSRAAAESRLKDADKKAQEYCYELAQVKRDLEQARAAGGTPSDELEALKREVRVNEEQIGDLKRERREGREENERLREEKVALEKEVTTLATAAVASPGKRPKGIMTVEQRLNKTVGEKRELEKECASLRTQIDTMMEATDDKQQVIQKFQRDLDTSQHVSLSLRRESEEYQVRLTHQQEHFESRLAGLREAEDSKSADCAALQENLASVHSQLEQRTEQIDAMMREAEKKQSELHHLRSRHGQLDGEVERLRGELRQAEVAIKGYEDECKHVIKDYTACAEELAVVKEDRDILASQLTEMNTQLTEKADRIGTLEKQQEEKNQHMAFQLSAYAQDFDKERKAREDAFKAKGIAEGEIIRLQEEIKALQRRYSEVVTQKLQTDLTLETMQQEVEQYQSLLTLQSQLSHQT